MLVPKDEWCLLFRGSIVLLKVEREPEVEQSEARARTGRQGGVSSVNRAVVIQEQKVEPLRPFTAV